MSDQFCQVLGPMTAVPNWLIYELTPDISKPGHYRKRPVRYDGQPIPKHGMRDNLLAYDVALGWVKELNNRAGIQYPANLAYVPGFWFSENCGFWFLDVDDALTPGRQWASQHAYDLYHLLVEQYGAAHEWSSSGLGFHVFGTGLLPAHGKKNSALGLELYTEERGVAFGLSGQLAGALNSPAATQYITTRLIPTCFPFESLNGAYDELDFTDAPQVANYRGPSDDEELLAMMMRSKSQKAMFGNGATFEQLWTNNEQVRRFYGGDSEIDEALILLLAFWTGKNPVRIERFMWRSALAKGREQRWNRNSGRNLTYLRYSILKGCAAVSSTYEPKEVAKPEQHSPQGEGTTYAAVGRDRGDNERSFLGLDQQKELFAGCVYVREMNMIWVPVREGYGELMDMSRFNIHFGGRTFALDKANCNIKKKAWDAFTQNEDHDFPRADKVAFEPLLPEGQISVVNGERILNTWVKIPVPQVPCSNEELDEYLFDLVRRLLPDQRDQCILLYYMAAVVQHQGVKFGWCPVLQGTQGNGKSTLGKMVERAVSVRMTHRARNVDLTAKFNSWMYGHTFVVVDDVRVDRRDKAGLEMLKPMISDEYIPIEQKGRDTVTRRVCGNFFMTMNDKSGIPREKNERRYALFFSAQQSKEERDRDMPGDYFKELFEWLENEDGYAKVAWWLWNVPIPDEFNPAVTLSRAPLTSSEAEIRAENKSDVVQCLEEAIAGEFPGFAGGYVCASRARDYLDSQGFKVTPQQLGRALESMEYIPHPKLGKYGQTDNPLPMEQNRKVKLYVVTDHPTIIENTWRNSEIAKDYSDKQALATLPTAAKIP